MKIITAPDIPKLSEVSHNEIFLAGGISNCPDWQTDVLDMLKDVKEEFTIYNPRREQFDLSDPTYSEEQIEWEHDKLSLVNNVIFWFPCETVCPITLYELGVAATKWKKLFVGCHPDYVRKFDVIKQLSLCRPEIVVRDSLEEIVSDVKVFLDNPFKIENNSWRTSWSAGNEVW